MGPVGRQVEECGRRSDPAIGHGGGLRNAAAFLWEKYFSFFSTATGCEP